MGESSASPNRAGELAGTLLRNETQGGGVTDTTSSTDPNDPAVLEARFVELVGSSWKRWNTWEHARRCDDVALGAVIASFVDSGWQLIDLESDGRVHMVRFQSGDHRLAVGITALAEDPVRAATAGRLIQVSVAYGQRVRDFSRIMSTLKQEMKSSMIANADEPGVITFDADMSSGFVYAQVNLLLNLDDYFDGLVQRNPISRDLYAAVHSLSRYLHGRIGG